MITVVNKLVITCLLSDSYSYHPIVYRNQLDTFDLVNYLVPLSYKLRYAVLRTETGHGAMSDTPGRVCAFDEQYVVELWIAIFQFDSMFDDHLIFCLFNEQEIKKGQYTRDKKGVHLNCFSIKVQPRDLWISDVMTYRRFVLCMVSSLIVVNGEFIGIEYPP